MSETLRPRYAIYYAPATDSPWWQFGAHWLGRDDVTGHALPQPAVASVGAQALADITEAPRRYGFHATLKAPFRLAEGRTGDELLARVEALARTLQPVPLGTLVPVFMDHFVALVPAVRNPALAALAQSCVEGLADLRAPLDAAERARRRPEALDDRGRELLDRYGYPHVLERYRFHMTLTGAIDTGQAGQLVPQLAHTVAELNRQVAPVLDRLCVFTESARGAPFLRTADFVVSDSGCRDRER